MALRIGSLYVSLTAQTDGFAKSMSAAMKDVERFSREVKKAANDAAQIAGGITALGAAALKLGSDVSGPAKAALDEFSRSAKQAAAPVAEALVPAVREAAAVVRGAGEAFRQLSPETKAMVAEAFKVAAAVTAGSLALGKLASTANLVAGVLSGTFGAIAAVGTGPLLGIVAGIGLVVGALTLLHRAWRLNWGGIQEVTAGVVDAIKGMFGGLVDTVGKVFDWLVDAVAKWVDWNLDAIDRVQKAFGVQVFNVDGMRAGFQGLFKDLKSGAFISEAVKFGKTVGKEMGAALLEEWKLIGKELGIDQLVAKVRGLNAGLRGSGAGGSPAASDMSGYVEMRRAAERAAASPEAYGPRTAKPGARLSQTSTAGGDTAQARRFASQVSRQAAKVAEEEAAKAKAAAEEAAAATRASLLGTVQGFVGKLGDLGGMVNGVVNAAMTGGPWAALAAGIGSLLSQSEAFGRLMEQAAGGLKMVLDAFAPSAEAILDALGNVLAPALQVVATALKVAAPLFKVVGELLNALAPLLALLVPVVEALAPIIQVLASVLSGIVKMLEPVFRVLYDIGKVLFTVIFAVIRALGALYNAMVEGIGRAMGQILDMLTNMFGTAGPGAEAVRKLREMVGGALGAVRIDTSQLEALDGAMANLMNSTYDSAAASVERMRADQVATGAAKENAKTVQKVTEAFLNVPSGFKVAAARFNADSAFSVGAGPAGGSIFSVGTVNIYANDSQEALDALFSAAERRTFRSTGISSATFNRNLR